MSEILSQPIFAEQLNSIFRVAVEGQEPIELVLSKVSELNRNYGTELFSIEFKGPKDFVLPQRTYQNEHAVMVKFDIMLVPIGRDEQGVDYEAVFNRLL